MTDPAHTIWIPAGATLDIFHGDKLVTRGRILTDHLATLDADCTRVGDNLAVPFGADATAMVSRDEVVLERHSGALSLLLRGRREQVARCEAFIAHRLRPEDDDNPATDADPEPDVDDWMDIARTAMLLGFPVYRSPHNPTIAHALSRSPKRKHNAYRLHLSPDGAPLSCSCLAEFHDTPCWHKRAILLLTEAERAWAREICRGSSPSDATLLWDDLRAAFKKSEVIEAVALFIAVSRLTRRAA